MTTELTNAVTALNDVTQKHEQLNEKYQGTHDALSSNSKAMTDWQTQQGTVELTDQHGNKHPTPTLKTLVEQAQSVNPHPHAMTKAQFDALRELRKQQYAGSGFVEWGKHHTDLEHVNEGMWMYQSSTAWRNKISLGRGNNLCDYPVVVTDGVTHRLFGTWDAKNPLEMTRALLPDAPDGTKTYDSATGAVTQHTNAEVAFASETATNKVITSRKELVFLESWHEKIADKDVVYPLGNVQYGASSYEGVTLLNNLVAQGYSAFGEWDENTKGYGVKWSSLTDAQKALFLSEPEHNIYFDPRANAYIQVRYRIRVVEGSSDIWPLTSPTKNDYFLAGEFKSHVAPQGNLIVSKCLTPGYPVFLSTNRGDAVLKHDNHIYGAVDSNNSNVSIAHNGKCFALPIALVQRMNQGAYHPVYNPMGCRSWNQQDNGGAAKWHSPEVGNVTNIIQAFDIKHGVSNRVGAHLATGSIEAGQSGRSDQYKYYDAIYAGQVEDLRLNANKLDVNKLREDAMRKAVAGKMRGKGRVLFTQFKALNQGYYRSSNQYHASFFNSATDGQLLEMHENEYTAGTSVMVWQPATNTVLYGRISNSNGHMALTQNLSNLGNFLHTHALHSTGLVNTEVCYFAQVTYLTPEFDSLPWVDIIGHPERIAATFPDGVVGQWVPQVPDGTSTNYQSNRKFTQEGTRTITDDDGSSWTFFSSWAGQSGGDLITNTVAEGPVPASRVALNFYETHSNFTESSNNAVVVGDVGNVLTTGDRFVIQGNRFIPSLIGLIGKDNQNGNQLRHNSVMNAPLTHAGKLWPANKVTHTQISLSKTLNNSPAVKALSTITEKNGLYYLQLHGAELKHTPITQADMTIINADSPTGVITKGKVYLFRGYDNALINRPIIAIDNNASITWHANVFDGYTINSIGQVIDRLGKVNPLLRAFECHWGDDQTIPIIDGENIKTDLNGNTVKVFCHHTQIPLGIAHND